MKLFKKTLFVTLSVVVAGIVSLFTIDYHVKTFANKYIMNINELPNADAVLVLGAYVYPDGHVSTILHDRLETAIEVYKEDKSSKIIVSGDHGRKDYDEVNTMKQYLLKQDFKNEDVFMDHAGFNTYQSMYRARDIFKVNKLIIVTQDYHLSRAVYLARKMGIEAYGVAADKNSYGDILKVYKAREILARNKDFINVNITKPKPRYLGDVIPITASGSLTNDM
ncbi:vancomycin high temperature exclusion protein [Paenibacillus sp. N3.4]|uniref:SanA/YdcF family protein n=1 Tax=Paenibacillus sp. N3.4 TaxID=2603222 RepID=UPI0021C4762B|nr:ElyC/SanA/YdcF family protein [Paenibacillus sp. N3.4]